MNKEQIEALALEAYPIDRSDLKLYFTDNGDKVYLDVNLRDRIAFIEGLKKASELLYSKRDIDKAIAYGIILEY